MRPHALGRRTPCRTGGGCPSAFPGARRVCGPCRHAHGAYLPYGLIVPVNTSTRLVGPYTPGAYRVEFDSLYTNTVIVTPYRGAGRPQGVFVMERAMDAIAAELGGKACLYVIFRSTSPTDSTLGAMENLLSCLDTALRRVKPLLNQPHVAPFSSDAPKNGEVHGLTTREVGILNWVRVGKTNSEIASILGISPYTVKNHMQSIFKKLDVYNRVQAIAKVAQPQP